MVFTVVVFFLLERIWLIRSLSFCETGQSQKSSFVFPKLLICISATVKQCLSLGSKDPTLCLSKAVKELKYSPHDGHWFLSPLNFRPGVPFKISGKRRTEDFFTPARDNLPPSCFLSKYFLELLVMFAPLFRNIIDMGAR